MTVSVHWLLPLLLATAHATPSRVSAQSPNASLCAPCPPLARACSCDARAVALAPGSYPVLRNGSLPALGVQLCRWPWHRACRGQVTLPTVAAALPTVAARLPPLCAAGHAGRLCSRCACTATDLPLCYFADRVSRRLRLLCVTCAQRVFCVCL